MWGENKMKIRSRITRKIIILLFNGMSALEASARVRLTRCAELFDVMGKAHPHIFSYLS